MKTKRIVNILLVGVFVAAAALAGHWLLQQHRNDELSRAASAGDLASVRRYVDAGADLNRGPRTPESGYGLPPLTVAASAGQTEVVRYLLDRGANPNRRGMGNPLIVACWRRHFDVAKLLLERGADPNVRGEGTPLTAADSTNQPELVALLQAHGAKQ